MLSCLPKNLSVPAYRTHSPHGPSFLPYFRTFCIKGILLCDQYEISYNLFSKLVPGCYISWTHYILSNLLLQSTAKFYPRQYLPFLSHTARTYILYCFHSFSFSFASFTLYSFGSSQPLRC